MSKKRKLIYATVCIAILCTTAIWGMISYGKGNRQDANMNQSVGGRKIAFFETGVADEIREYTQEEIEQESEVIVRGETIDYKSYMAGPENIWTIEYVKVLECIRGNLSIGDVIEVDKMGGYVLAKDYIAAYLDVERDIMVNAKFSRYSNEEINSEYIAQRAAFDAEIAIGKQSIFYLESNGSQLYTRVADYRGETVITEGDKNILPSDFTEGNAYMADEISDDLELPSEVPTKEESNVLENNG